MIRRSLLVLLISAGWSCTAFASDRDEQPQSPDILITASMKPFGNAPRVPDDKLATMRAGMLLPNGFDVAIGIDIQTRVDGVLVLHTIYSSDGPIIGTRVYTDGRDGERLAPGTVVVTTPGSSGAPAIEISRSPSGTSIAAGTQEGAAVVNLVSGPEATWVNAEGQTEIPVMINGASVTTGPGTFALATGPNGTVATLDTGDLQIRHLIGQATGVVIANTANNRMIDTISSVNIDLANVAPLVATSIFSSQALALDIVRNR